MKIKKIIPVLLCLLMLIQTAAANDTQCIFKNSSSNETKQLVSGDIYVYAPKQIIDESSEINILPAPQIKMMKNDGNGEAKASGTVTTAEKAVDGDVSTMARATEILMEYLKENLNGDDKLETEFMEKIKSLTELNYDKPEYDLNYIAGVLGITSVHASRKFKKLSGQNFSQYLSEFRLNKAKKTFGGNRS